MSYREIDKLKNLSFDVAVTHFYHFDFLINEEILKGRPLVYIVHSVPTTEPYTIHDPFGGNLHIKGQFEKSCQRANIIVNISIAEQKKLSQLYPQLAGRSCVIHNGMDFNKDTPTKSNTNHQQHFGFLGRLDHRKGLLETVKAFKHLDAHLHIACGNEDPFYFNQILSYVEAADIHDKIHFHGWCQGKRKESFLAFIDALIVPSLYEPFGYVVLEAMLHKTPLICSSSGAFPEIVGEYPYMYDPYQPSALVECIQNFQGDSVDNILIHMERLYERLPLFTSELMVKQYDLLFQRLVAH